MLKYHLFAQLSERTTRLNIVEKLYKKFYKKGKKCIRLISFINQYLQLTSKRKIMNVDTCLLN
jgi:hypothetical protein